MAIVLGLMLILNEFLDGFDKGMNVGIDVLPLIRPLSILRETEPLCQYLQQVEFLVKCYG